MINVFDGHNDTLTKIHYYDVAEDFVKGDIERFHIDLPRALEAGFRGGIFAIMTPNDLAARRVEIGETRLFPVQQEFALRFTVSVMALAFRLTRACDSLRIVTEAEQLEGDGVGMVLHIEGAEAIDPGLNALEVLYAAGLRSIGLVWSRPNVFAEGVPFEFPASPDTGPGLTSAGKRLVRACNELGIAIDLSHLNEKGFWDVEKLSNAPLIASHSNAHAICPHTRNLTDAQLDAVKASGGIVGVNFGVTFLTDQGPKAEKSTPMDAVVRHFVYLAERMGTDHVGFGSDFDGTRVPYEIRSVSGVTPLVERLRQEFGEADVERITHGNWHRVLSATWR